MEDGPDDAARRRQHPHVALGARHELTRTQALLDDIVYGGRWGAGEHYFPISWLPFESSRTRWNATRGDAAIFNGTSIVVLGSSPMRQLALHWHWLASGAMDHHQIHLSASAESKGFYQHCQQGARVGWVCDELPCNATIGSGCHDCFCCCGQPRCCCGSSSNRCTGNDFVLTRDVQWTPSEPQHLALQPDVEVTFTWKPELLHVEADERALATQFCVNPPSLFVVGSKGVHDSYFDAYTLVGPLNHSDRSQNRISAEEHGRRMEQHLRRYVRLLDCLPSSTFIVWLTPYHSTKTPWESVLVNATRVEMLKLRDEGLFSGMLFFDTWHLTAMPGAPRSLDGNHRTTPFQTLVWTMIRWAYARHSRAATSRDRIRRTRRTR